MKILITTYHLKNFEGTETYTYTLAVFLKKFGHEICVYSPHIGFMADKLISCGVKVVSDLKYVKNEKFDIIHAQHNYTAVQTCVYFPKVPMVFNVHGVLPKLEQRPWLNIGIDKYIAVSEEVRDYLLLNNIDNNKINLIRNFVDIERFISKKDIGEKLTNILIISNRITEEKLKIITKVCEELKINFSIIGKKSEPVWEVEDYINKSDLIISLGRGILEAMACSRAVLVYDYNGGDGIVVNDNYREIRKNNFSGRRFKKDFVIDSLLKELGKYNVEMGEINRKIIEKHHNASKNVRELISIYEAIISQKKERPSLLFMMIPFYISKKILPGVQFLINKLKERLELLF